MESGCRIDMSGWENKSRAIQIAIAKAVVAAVDFGLDTLYRETVKNVMGIRHNERTPSPYPGVLPVTKISGKLGTSITEKRHDAVSGYVYADETKANYAKYVHDGTRKMRPRPFLRAAVQARKEAIINRMRNLILIEVRRAGGGMGI